MDNKKKFIKPEAEIYLFSDAEIYTDIISTSVMEGGDFDENQVP